MVLFTCHRHSDRMALRYLLRQVPLHCNRTSPLLQFMFQALPRGSKKYALEHLSGVRLCAQLPAPSITDTKDTQKTDSSASAAEKIKNLDEEMTKKLKILQLEYEVMKQLGSFRVPDNMTDELWLEMLTFPTVSARKRYYRYLKKVEAAKLGRQLKRQKKLEDTLVKEQDKPSQSKNTIFMFIRKSTINSFYYSRLAHAMMFGQPIIFDMSFENYMRKQDVHRLCEQFLMGYGSNKVHPDPFHFVLSGNQSNSMFQNCLDNTRVNKHEEEHFLMTNSDQHYLNLYPREKLVYLTPDAPSVLQTFDHDAIYVVGGLVDKVVPKPLTMAKAKKERLKMAKLPLDNYIRWGCGNKSLTLNQVVDILLEVKRGSSWTEAFRHIPQRKIRYLLKD
ncbi:Hypothetical predicted protein [Octopus vulgaris]|uniref:RNA (guanine-9-)-methyltransferase domain-containing protein 1 n=2 Tax=Octopus vulgaris TaxID=6645 RepID=A0AA36B9E9_OCTVU|nr:Hypothetical predicted protein [Octopus vulgaris]